MTAHLRKSLDDELPLTQLKVQGTLPEWLKGTLIRNGPAKFEVGHKKVYHWFDGLAMLHAFHFEKGAVSYTNRFLRTDAYRQVFEKGSMDYLGFAQDPCRSLFRRVVSAFFPKPCMPNADVNVARYFEQYVALTETPLPVCFEPECLKTVGPFLYQDTLPKANIWESAHPHVDAWGNYNMILEFGLRAHYLFWHMPKGTSERKMVAKIPVSHPSYMHTFSVTENYFIYVEYPLVVNPLMPLFSNQGFIQNFKWRPERQTWVNVVQRTTGKHLYKVPLAPFFAFHHVNAYEMGDEILIDLITYSDASIVLDLASYGLANQKLPLSKLQRLHISPTKGYTEVLFDFPFELPRFHPHLDGKPYRYFYATDLREGKARNLYKLDVQARQFKTWSSPTSQPAEPIFVPSPYGNSEDKGVVISIILEDETCYLLVLEGQGFTELARVNIPHFVPLGLHGLFQMG